MEIFIAAFSLCEDNGQWCVYTKTLLVLSTTRDLKNHKQQKNCKSESHWGLISDGDQK